MSINNVLASLSDNNIEGDYIKYQEGFSDYYSGFGWFGAIEYMNNISTYKLYMSNNGQLVYQGNPVDLATSPISIDPGWNWIAYLPQDALDINTALASVDGSAIYIKDSQGFSDYYEGFGWFGAIEELRPTNGYVLDASQSATLIYPESSELMTSSNLSELTKTIDPHWSYDYSEYEHNGSVMIELDLANIEIHENAQIAAFYNNDIRGTAFAIKCPINNKIVFPMMIHSNDNDINISFKYYDSINDKEIDLQQTITYVHDMHLNNALDPYILSDEMPLTYSLSNAYPNPFNPTTTISYSIADDIDNLKINIYDIRGRIVQTLHDGQMYKGEHKIHWNASEFASGVYFVHMIASEHIFTKKIMLVK